MQIFKGRNFSWMLEMGNWKQWKLKLEIEN